MRDLELSPRLRAAIEVLRESSNPGARWRSELLARIADDPGSSAEVIPWHGQRRGARVWSVRPLAALAAGVACVLLGAATAVLMLLGRGGSPNGVTHELRPMASAAGVLPVRFTLVAPGAAHVSLVGDFNRWNPVALPLRLAADGRTWEVEVRLQPGRYSYSFVVDGKLARDPTAPQDAADDYGSPNSVLLLRGS